MLLYSFFCLGCTTSDVFLLLIMNQLMPAHPSPSSSSFSSWWSTTTWSSWCSDSNYSRYSFPFGRPEGALKATLTLLDRVLMKDGLTPAPPEEVRSVIRKCLENAALVNYNKISEIARIEGMTMMFFHSNYYYYHVWCLVWYWLPYLPLPIFFSYLHHKSCRIPLLLVTCHVMSCILVLWLVNSLLLPIIFIFNEKSKKQQMSDFWNQVIIWYNSSCDH